MRDEDCEKFKAGHGIKIQRRDRDKFHLKSEKRDWTDKSRIVDEPKRLKIHEGETLLLFK